MLRSLAFALALAKYDLPVYFVGGIGGFIGVTIYAFFHNRMMAYVEDCIYGGKWDEYKGKKTLIKNGMKAVGKNKIRNCCDGKR